MCIMGGNAAAVRGWRGQNVGCIWSWSGSSLLNDHLGIRAGDKCLVTIVDMFEATLARGVRPVLDGMRT